MNWYLKVWKQYADFKGRARRKEFWMFALFNSLIGFVAVGIALTLVFIGISTFNLWLSIIGYILLAVLGLYSLAILVPSLALAVRRLHDIGKSGWYYLFGFIPLAGGIILLVWFCQDSQVGENQWGANPKEEYRPDFVETNHHNQPIQHNNSFPRLQCRAGYDNFTYNITKPRTTIGRGHDNDVVLNHLTVSRHHAEIVNNGYGYEIIDLGSTNKVIVNGDFFQRKILMDGDIFGLGEAVLTFYM